MLESFPDPLGKPMQIHEITRRTVTEAGLMGQIGSNAAAGLANKLLPGSAPADRLVGTPTSGGLRQAAAGQMNKTLLAPLAKEMQKRWAQTVQQLLIKSVDKTTGAPVTSAAQIDRAALEKEFYLFMNALVGFDVGTIASMDDGSGQAKQLDSELKPQITAAIANTQKPVTGANVWLPLATSVQRAKSISQFSSKPGNKTAGPGKYLPVTGTGQAGKVLVNGQPYNRTNPLHLASVQAAGIDPATLK